MTTNEFIVRCLKADSGHWLTQKEVENPKERKFFTTVYPAKNLPEDYWVEWTDGQKQQWEEDHPFKAELEEERAIREQGLRAEEAEVVADAEIIEEQTQEEEERVNE